MSMWWILLQEQAERFQGGFTPYRDPSAVIAKTATLEGEVSVGRNTKICAGAFIQGPVVIGDNCLVGNNTMIRGPLTIGHGSRIGYAAEIKGSIIGENVMIGPMCFIGDSVIDERAYLGAMVRTSNQRLDLEPVSVLYDGVRYATGMEKLGCHIGARASLGIQVIILPGRMVAPGSLFGPRITVEKNLPAGRYTLKQELSSSVFPVTT